jgi:NAD-dependent SIR2 family protein deacetylase
MTYHSSADQSRNAVCRWSRYISGIEPPGIDHPYFVKNADLISKMQTFREKNGNLRPEYENIMNYPNFFSNLQAERFYLWKFAQRVMEVQHQPRTKMHILLNYLAENGRIRVITTNIDGLEILPQINAKGPTRTPSLSKETGTLVQLYGQINTVMCSGCWRKYPLDEENVAQLIGRIYPPCKHCKGQTKGQRSSSIIWRPDIRFHDDPREPSRDEDGRKARPTKKPKKSAPPKPKELDADDHYSAIMHGDDFVPAQVFIVGSSLSDRKLRSDLINLCKRGTQAYIVNTMLNTYSNSIPGAIFINLTSEDFAIKVFNTLIGMDT